MLEKLKEKPLRQEVQRAVRQRQGQTVGAVLLLGQQAARMLANLAGGAQRVRSDDARERPRAGRRRSTKGSASWKCSSKASARSACKIQQADGTTRKCGRRSSSTPAVKRPAAESIEASRLGSRAEKGAIWTYWKGAYRDTGRDEGATVVIQTASKKGWFWYIPLHDDSVSVGVVAPFDYLFRVRVSHEQIYNEEVESCPAVQETLAVGQRATGYFATKDYSYRSNRWQATAG